MKAGHWCTCTMARLTSLAHVCVRVFSGSVRQDRRAVGRVPAKEVVRQACKAVRVPDRAKCAALTRKADGGRLNGDNTTAKKPGMTYVRVPKLSYSICSRYKQQELRNDVAHASPDIHLV